MCVLCLLLPHTLSPLISIGFLLYNTEVPILARLILFFLLRSLTLARQWWYSAWVRPATFGVACFAKEWCRDEGSRRAGAEQGQMSRQASFIHTCWWWWWSDASGQFDTQLVWLGGGCSSLQWSPITCCWRAIPHVGYVYYTKYVFDIVLKWPWHLLTVGHFN